MRLPLLILAASFLAAGCYDPAIESGKLLCSADRRCPQGFACAPDARCWRPGDADLAPKRIAGGLTGNGGAMRSPSYLLVGGLGPRIGGPQASASYRMADGSPGRTREQ
jgi:hypothetical protein